MSTVWYARNVGDYQRKTRHLSMLEHGAYTMLLDWYYANDRAPDANASVLHRICMAFAPEEQAAMHRVLTEFFDLRDGRWYNDRAEEELAKRRAISEKRQKAAGKRWSAPDASASANACTTTTTTTDKKDRAKALAPPAARVTDFQTFWNAYPHRDGVKRARAKVEAKYRAAVKSGVPEQAFLDAVQRLKADKRVKDGFARDPLTWINQRGWEDEAPAAPTDDRKLDVFRARLREGKPLYADYMTVEHTEALIAEGSLSREDAKRMCLPLAADPIRRTA